MRGWILIVALALVGPASTALAAECVGPACAEHDRVTEGGSCEPADNQPARRASYTNASLAAGDVGTRVEVHLVCDNFQDPNMVGSVEHEYMWTNLTLASPGRVDRAQVGYFYGLGHPSCVASVVVDPDAVPITNPYVRRDFVLPNCEGEDFPSVAEVLP